MHGIFQKINVFYIKTIVCFTHTHARACTHTHRMQGQNFASTEISMPEEGKHVERYFNP